MPIGSQCQEDFLLMKEAGRLGLPLESGFVLYNRLSTQEGVKFQEIQGFLKHFASVDANKDGWVTPGEMASFLGQGQGEPPNNVDASSLQALFKSADGVRDNYNVTTNGCIQTPFFLDNKGEAQF